MNIYLVAISIYLLATIFIGFMSSRSAGSYDLKEFLIANRSLSPLTIGLSYVASEISVGTFTVAAGMIYVIGLNRMWVDAGFLIFSVLCWQLIGKKLRIHSKKQNDSCTIPEFFANRFQSRAVGLISAMIITFFTTTYIGANILGFTKVVSYMIDISPNLLAIPILLVTVLYVSVGGFRSTCYTDVIQGFIMLFATTVLPVVLILNLGTGPLIEFFHNTTSEQQVISHHSVGALEALLYLSFASALFGMPHTITRFLAIKSPEGIKKARNISIIFNLALYLGIVIAAIYGRSLIPFAKNPEMIFFIIAKTLVDPILGSIVVIAALSAVMSTIDSQLIVASSCMVNDIYKPLTKSKCDDHFVGIARITTIVISTLALIISFLFHKSVAALAAFSLTGLGASIGPIVILSLYSQTKNKIPIILGLLTGTVSTLVFTFFNTSDVHYIMLPALCASVVVISLSYYITVKCNWSVEQ